MLQSLLVAMLVHAGSTLQGTVRAEGTHEPIAHARLQIAELGRAVVTEAEGYFVIADIPEGRWRLKASALGYGTVEFTFVSSGAGSIRLDVVLPATASRARSG